MYKVKENDVYKFRYKDTSDMFEPYHCFDGTLIAKETNSGITFKDTYWSGSDGRCFKIDEAFEKGEMKFLCNFGDVDEIDKSQTKYYDTGDIIHLRIHAGYRDRYFINKGTKRSKEAMLSYCRDKINDAKSDIRMAERKMLRYKEKREEIQNGNTDIYI